MVSIQLEVITNNIYTLPQALVKWLYLKFFVIHYKTKPTINAKTEFNLPNIGIEAKT